jgi:hypothetical protein
MQNEDAKGDYKTQGFTRNLLHEALEDGNFKKANCMIKQGADLKLRGWCENTPLHWIARCTEYNQTLNLLKNGCDVNAKDFARGYTPLHFAICNENFTLVCWLIKNGANVNLRSGNGVSPLQIANQVSSFGIGLKEDIIKFLVENGATLYPDFDKEGDEEFIIYGREFRLSGGKLTMKKKRDEITITK